MNNTLVVLTVVIVIAATEIWCVLRDIRKALQTIADHLDKPEGKVSKIADAMHSIGSILFDIYAEMSGLSSEHDPRQSGARNSGGK